LAEAPKKKAVMEELLHQTRQGERQLDLNSGSRAITKACHNV